MNSSHRFLFVLSAAFAVMMNCRALGQGLTIPSKDAAIADSISNVPPTPYTVEEKATPPPGEIRKLHLRNIVLARRALQEALASVPVEERSNPYYGVALSAEQKLESISVQRKQDQFFSLIEDMFTLEHADRREEDPLFISNAFYALEGLKSILVEEIADAIVLMDATIPPSMLSRFVSAFSLGQIIIDCDWEDREIPISSPGIMILDATTVTAQLKSQPWQNAERFLGRATAAQAFSPYTPTGDGLEVLKTKFAADKTTIVAKWDELAAWVAQQRAANPE